MKRFVKWFLILGIIFCVVGIGTITAGAVLGGGILLEGGLYKDQLWSIIPVIR